jgi:hypothetical protein
MPVNSARYLVNVDMSGDVNSATLFPLSNSLLAVRLLFCGYKGGFNKN